MEETIKERTIKRVNHIDALFDMNGFTTLPSHNEGETMKTTGGYGKSIIAVEVCGRMDYIDIYVLTINEDSKLNKTEAIISRVAPHHINFVLTAVINQVKLNERMN